MGVSNGMSLSRSWLIPSRVSKNPILVEIQALNDCGTKLSIHVTSQIASLGTQKRRTTWLTAIETKSKKELNCEIFVDNIDRIEISTTTRTIFKDETHPLSIRGFDQAGNTFSDLEGLDFSWAIHHEPGPSLVQFVGVQEKRSSNVQLRGVEVGRVVVTALLENMPIHKELKANVSLSILEHLSLDPAHDLYLTQKAQFQLRLTTSHKAETEFISMPNPLYRWASDAPSVATVTQSGTIETLALGRTQVEATFVQMPDNMVRILFF